MKLFDDPNIPGIPTYAMGAELSFAGYVDILVPEGYRDNKQEHINSSAYAKSFEKDNVLYISIAGTNREDFFTKKTDLGNWLTFGADHFEKLDPEIGPLIKNAKSEGKRVVILGDSGGGLAAQFFRHKYDVDIFVTNTAYVLDVDFRKRTGENSSVKYSKAIAFNLSGEPFSKAYHGLNKLSDMEVYYAPSELDAKILISEKYEGNAPNYLNSRIELHTDRNVLTGKYGDYPLQNTPWTLDDYIRNPETRPLYDNAERAWREKIEKFQRDWGNFEYDGMTQRNLIMNKDFIVAEKKDVFRLWIDNIYYDTLDT